MVVDWLTKTAHFLLMNMKYPLEKLAKLYMDEIVRLHGITVSIVSDRDPRFVSRFLAKISRDFGDQIKLEYSISSPNGWTVGEDTLDFGEYVKIMYNEIRKKLESPYDIG